MAVGQILTPIAIELGRYLIDRGFQKLGEKTALTAASRAVRIDPLQRAAWLKAKGLTDQRRG